MTDKKAGPRFSIGSTRPGAGAGVVDELIGKVPAQEPASSITADEKGVNDAAVQAGDKFVTASATDAFVDKFVNGVVPTLEDCERHITAITTQWLLGVGRALAAIRDHELFKEKGYTSFTAYLRTEHPWHPSYVSRVIANIPVVEALERHGADRDLNEGQATAIRPVWEQHGEEALFEVWDATTGKRSATALARVARAKGYLDPVDEQAQARSALSGLAQFKPVLKALSDLRALRQAAFESPEGARELAATLRTALAELEADLESAAKAEED
ncbi:hypothetical protein AB0J28_04570 [Streptosporangium canum]|uniref:hypothetical protein n=1 Tax=Streptosporangium canum TaxID=324952 RepID=UPI003445D699